MSWAFRAGPARDPDAASGTAGWIVVSVPTLPAPALFLGSLRSNPAVPPDLPIASRTALIALPATR